MDSWHLVGLRRQPPHAPRWANKTVGVFRYPPMTYIFVFNEDATLHAWPDSLDRLAAEAVRQRFLHCLKEI